MDLWVSPSVNYVYYNRLQYTGYELRSKRQRGTHSAALAYQHGAERPEGVSPGTVLIVWTESSLTALCLVPPSITN